MTKDGPTFFRAGDRIKFHPVSEGEVQEIYARVHEAPYDYEYDIAEDTFEVAAYLAFRSSREVEEGANELRAKQAVGVRTAPAL